MDTPDPAVANWLRLAFDDIAERERSSGGKAIDADALLAFVRDGKRQGRPRRLALDLVEELCPGARKKLLPGWLDDPEFRHDAIEDLLDRVRRDKALPKEKAIETLRTGFRASRDLAQARAVAARLKELGETVSVARHMGFLGDWYVIGPFDAGGGKGFRTAYPPEKKVDLAATHEGQGGKQLTWRRETVAESATGRFPILVDLRKPLGDADDAVAYAWTGFTVPKEQTVEFRGAADDNLTVFVNGVRAFGYEEYQNGVRLDRHRFAVKLRAGVNTVLVKVCQAPANAAPNWEFLLRITDPSGQGVSFPMALGRPGATLRVPGRAGKSAAGHPKGRAAPTIGLLAGALALADWPAWRGPGHDGVSEEKNLPVTWSAKENVRWKAAIPGAGVSAPVVTGDRVLLTSSSGRDGETLHLFCLGAGDGKMRWQRRFFGSEVSEGQYAPGGMAVPTPATDGKRVFALFGTGDLVCLDLDGRPLWIRSLAREYGAFRNRWGMASSPLLLGDLLVVQVDHHGGSYLLGVEAGTGRNRWRTPRDAAVNWTSPVAVRLGEKTFIVAAGTHTLKGYDLATGREQWSLSGLEMQCIPTPVVRGDRLWLAGGADFTSLCVALRADGQGKAAARALWQVKTKGVGIPSPLLLGDHFYYAEDAGWACCLDASTGKQLWRRRLNTKVHASPVAGDGKVYFAGMNGVVTVLRAGAEFAVLARNDVGESIVASPAISGGRLFLRGEKHLFCVGER
jgi:outer membrane protein assembly factor BamB